MEGLTTPGGEKEIKLNLGCGGRPLPGYINVDMDSLEELRARYPFQDFPDGIEVHNFDILNLPFSDGTVMEIRADSLVEHLSFIEEPKFFHEVKRLLKPGGIFRFSTPDFEETIRLWLSARITGRNSIGMTRGPSHSSTGLDSTPIQWATAGATSWP